MKKIIVTQRYFKDFKTGEIRDSVDIRLSEFLLQLNLLPIFLPNNLGSTSYADLKQLIKNVNPNGLLLSGGEDIGKNISRDKLEKNLLKYFTAKKKPILGICRGMQVLSVFFGSKIIKVKNHVRTRRKCEIQTSDKLFPKTIKCFHNFAINKCPKNFFITMKSKDGTIESIKHLKNNWEGWMWHPERDKPFLKCLKDRTLKIFK